MAAREQVRDAADSPGTTPAPVPDRRLWPDALLLGLGALALRLPAFFAPANLGYDDGGYGLAAVAMRQGYAPFRDIFSSQGPLFLPLVRLADLAGLRPSTPLDRSRSSPASSSRWRSTSSAPSCWTGRGRCSQAA